MRDGFWKGHGLGNDYLVVDPRELSFRLSRRAVRGLCERHTGVGADGVLALVPSHAADFGVRIYNPDGSEAEKSGNGLRIFARFLHETGRTRKRRFSVETRAGVVGIELSRDASHADVEMGRASFRQVDAPIRVAGDALRFTGVSVGNPHCVLFRTRGRWAAAELRELGPRIERHKRFPRRTNVQLAAPRGRHALDVLVWERGAGETTASGSSACAAAAAGVRLGHVTSPVRVHMPGGRLDVAVSEDFELRLSGPVSAVANGVLAPSLVRSLSR